MDAPMFFQGLAQGGGNGTQRPNRIPSVSAYCENRHTEQACIHLMGVPAPIYCHLGSPRNLADRKLAPPVKWVQSNLQEFN